MTKKQRVRVRPKIRIKRTGKQNIVSGDTIKYIDDTGVVTAKIVSDYYLSGSGKHYFVLDIAGVKKVVPAKVIYPTSRIIDGVPLQEREKKTKDKRARQKKARREKRGKG